MLIGVVAACLLGLSPGAPVPESINVPAGRLGSIAIDTGGKGVSYAFVGDVDGFREYSPDSKLVILRVIGYSDGTAWLLVALSGDTAPSIYVCKVVIGAGPVPPPPPPPPAPSDPLYPVLQGLYAADSGATKAQDVKKLAALYQVGVTACDDPSLKSLGNLNAKMRDASAKILPDSAALKGVRTRVAQELAALGTSPVAPLTAELRAKAKGLFIRLAAIMNSLGSSGKKKGVRHAA